LKVPKYYGGDVAIPDSAFLYNHFGYKVSSSDKVYTYLNNNNTAYIRGVEIDWQTNFWYLPEPLNALVLDVNYTKSASHLDYRNLHLFQ
jgi:outer membrane receptor protein involved in Fe transport